MNKKLKDLRNLSKHLKFDRFARKIQMFRKIFEIFEFLVQCLSPLGALVPNVEMVWARARAEEAVASQTHRALFTFVANFCLTPASLWDASFWEQSWGTSHLLVATGG